MRTLIRRSISMAAVAAILATACGGGGGGGAAATSGAPAGGAVTAIAPTKPAEFVISTAPGGASDIYARRMQAIIDADKLTPMPLLSLIHI